MEPHNTTPRLVALAATIHDSVAKLQGILSAQGLPSPSFDEDNPTSLPPEASKVQDAVLDATAELHELLLEPLPLLFKFSATNSMVSIHAICRLNIASMVPVGGQKSFKDISVQTGLDEQITRRLLRHAMGMRIFREPEPGMVAHTKTSKMLLNPSVNAWMNCGAEESWVSSVKMVDALQKWPGSQEPNETAFALANNTENTIYEVISGDPQRGMRFASAMKAMALLPGYGTSDVVKNYDWASLGKAFVVDVGGSQGHIALEIAKHFSDINLLVQDMGKMVEGAEALVPDELKGQIKFMEHELFATQTVQADVYYFRMVFHNWSDKYCVLILKAQIPALKTGAKILIQDICMPEPAKLPLWKERDLRATDLNMGAFFNARERSLEEWKDLLAQADPRFVLRRVVEPKGSGLAMMEIIWNSE
ncbi:S-adenosyl-L-methionine-dependent methyltransferase [Annulohypoxylon moriforme]|nr:S-adenosyl-L-methionine-dependent methyltransferase [Annulohypoxylon moriforme]